MENIEEKHRWRDLCFDGYYKYVFNNKGQIIEDTWYDANDKILCKNTMAYNGMKYRIEQSSYSPEGISEKMICKLNKQGAIIGHERYTHVDGEGLVLAEIGVHCYNKNGKVKEVEHYDTDAKLIKSIKFHYNSRGILVKAFEWEIDHELTINVLHNYDNAGLKTECIIEYSETIPYFDYNKVVVKYDKRQNETFAGFYNQNNEIVKEKMWEFIYNDYNNWEEKLMYENGKLVQAVKREIEYWEES